jgi:anti-sigma factor RsiW
MECERYEKLVESYAAGDLGLAESQAVEKHLEECAACREEYDAYAAVMAEIADEPFLRPTGRESRELSRALSRARLDRHAACPASGRSQTLGFAAASALAFVFMVIALSLHVLGFIDILWMIKSVGLPMILGMAVGTVFVTSFIPIWVTARRRPLNGLTFSR